MSDTAILVIGIGNSFRRDDGAGPAVLQRLTGQSGLDLLVLPGEGSELIEAWRGAGKVVVVDAMRSGAEPGSLLRFDALKDTLPKDAFPCLSHQFGLAQAVEMARLLDRLPRELLIYGIEAGDLGQGPGLSAPVARAVENVAKAIASGLD